LNIASFIARRLVFQKDQSFSRFIIRLSTAATAVSVAIMIIAFAFVEGFQQTISSKIFSFSGHIRVQQHQTPANAEELPTENSDSIRQLLTRQQDVKFTDAVASKAAMLKTTETIEGVLLKGVEKTFSTERLLPFLIEGQWLQFTDSSYSPQVILSAYTAMQLKATVGTKVLVYFIDDNGEAPKVRTVTVCGIYKTSIEEYDKHIAIVDIRFIRKLNGWTDNQIGGYELTLTDYKKDAAVSNELLDKIPVQWFSTPVREIYPNIFDWLQLQNTNKYVVMIIMCVVAVINLISCLIILVLERSKMIGLLKATGADNVQVQTIFWNQALMITLAGMMIGTLLGIGLCWLQQSTGFIRLDETAYYVAKAPVKVIWWQVLLVNIATFIISFLILLVPSLVVRKITPVKALRFE
jgi:lipoprotein-releasing system permease protein